jgi:L-rhamnose mutarotase
MIRTYCFTLDLVNDPEKIAIYEAHHKAIWPEVKASILEAGIQRMDIFRWHNRLMMLMEVDESFSFEKKAAIDFNNPVVQRWEALMSTFQQPPNGYSGVDKWVLMDKIFGL